MQNSFSQAGNSFASPILEKINNRSSESKGAVISGLSEFYDDEEEKDKDIGDEVDILFSQDSLIEQEFDKNFQTFNDF
jgi:hypothetical protein